MGTNWRLADIGIYVEGWLGSIPSVDGYLGDMLRNEGYRKPLDCPGARGCPHHRTACMVGVCKVAVVLAGDF